MDGIVYEKPETKAEKCVRFMTYMITFMTDVQSVVRDLKLVGTKMGPINKRIVVAFDKFQNKFSPYEDVIRGARDYRNWLASLDSNSEEFTALKRYVRLQSFHLNKLLFSFCMKLKTPELNIFNSRWILSFQTHG